MPSDPNFHARMLLSRVPEEIRKSIGDDELNDRLVEAARLGAQANDPSLSPELRQAAKLRGQAVLQAQPRQATRQQHAQLIAKAAATPHRGQAEAIRRQAEELVSELHPIAPPWRGGGVRKAKADAEPDITPVFDENGQLVGVVDTDKIVPLSGRKPGAAPPPPPDQDPAAAPAPAPGGQPVTKASRLPVVVYDQRGAGYMVDRRNIRAVRKAGDDDLITMYDAAGRAYRVPRAAVQSPDAQARNRGPVNAGGTTGLGQPRKTGPAAGCPVTARRLRSRVTWRPGRSSSRSVPAGG